MKICLINNLYKPFSRGGAEKVTSIIAAGLLAAGHEVFIITTKPWATKPVNPDSRLPIFYLNSWYYHLNRLPKFFRFFWLLNDIFDFIGYFKIKSILRRQHCDLAITNNLMGLGGLTSLAIRRLKIKQIHLVHDLQLIHPSGIMYYGQEKSLETYFSRVYAGLMSYLIDSPAVAIFPSYWLRNRYLDKIFFIKSKRIVLANPAPAVQPAGVQPSNPPFKFLFIGQLEKHKGAGVLLEAFKLVKEKMPETELIIAGDGSQSLTLKSGYGRLPGVKFLGRQNEIQVAGLLTDCQALVVPTICYENCPTVILEAFSYGLPVIASDLGGIRELLGENAGLLTRPANAADLAEKMIWAARQPAELSAIKKAGQEKAGLMKVENYLRILMDYIK